MVPFSVKEPIPSGISECTGLKCLSLVHLKDMIVREINISLKAQETLARVTPESLGKGRLINTHAVMF